MPMQVLDAGSTLRTITAMTVKDSGVDRRIVRMKVLDTDGTTLRTVATFVDPLTLTASPSALLESTTISSATTSPTTATPSGGLAPYTYAWTKIAGGDITIGSPTSATTAFSATGLASPEEERSATFQCTATDSDGNTATALVGVTISRFSTL